MTKYQIQEKAEGWIVTMIHSSFHECTGLKHPVISQGEHLESNPQAHSWMMELLSVSTQGR